MDLNENNLVTLDSPIFEDLESLAFLDLSSNKLVRLDENVFRPLTQLAGLDISDNELTNPNFAVPESTEIIR